MHPLWRVRQIHRDPVRRLAQLTRASLPRSPLVKGVITPEGRIVCPWHGACFNACTGDIEDAPGLNNLSSYQVEQEGDKLFVTAPTEADALKATREPGAKNEIKIESDPKEKGILIVGGGAGGGIAVEALRESGYKGPIRVLTSESHLPVDRTKLSKGLIGDPNKVALRSAEFYKKLGVEFTLGKQVTKVDFEKDQVEVEGGETVSYDQIILATGGSPVRLPLKGADLGNITVLRQVNHAAEISKNLGTGDGPKPNIVVIGSSFIGLEAAGAAAAKANVSVVGMDKVPFEKILGADIGAALRKNHEKNGVKFYLPAELSHFEPKADNDKVVGSVELKDGTSIPADFVILGVGVKPQTSFLEGTLQLEKDGSVKVDEHLKIEQIAKGNAYAIGDIATYKDISVNQYTRIEHWNVASNHARAVAHNIAVEPAAFDKIAIFWSAQGQQLRYCGTGKSKEWEDVHIVGNPDELKFIAYYSKGDEVVAVASMQNDPVVAQASELLAQKKMPSISEIKQGKNLLEINLGDARR